MSNKSPLRYPGGKTRACKTLDSLIEDNFKISEFPIDKVISPFFGGGSFEFFLQNKYNLEIEANDKFLPLYNFWNIIKTNKTDLCNNIEPYLGKVTFPLFKNLREEIMDLSVDPLKQAVYYFIINRCSFSGATLSGGFSDESSQKRFTKSSIERISKLNLEKVKISNTDFTEFIPDSIEQNELLFLDPPYYLEKASNLYGNNGDMHEAFDHNALFTQLSNKKRWMMTYNNCDYIKELYKDFIIIEVDWKYGMNKSKKSSEIVIISK